MQRLNTPRETLPPLNSGNLTGVVLQENYRIDAIVRSGPNFTIYEAEHLRLARRVAVKCLAPSLSRDAFLVSRFEREVDLLSAFRHPHIVAIHDYDSTNDGRPYVVMEYLSGKTLLQHIRERRRFSPGEALEIVSQIGSALGAAHAMEMVHGALAPANVFLSNRDKGIFVKLIGFDAQAQEKLSPAEDQRALAVVLYELLTGRPLTGFPSKRGLPERLAPVLLQALDKEPGRRFGSILEFCSSLRKAAGLKSHRASLSPPRDSQVRARPKTGDAPAPLDLLPCRAPTLPGGSVAPGAPTSLSGRLEQARIEAAMGNVHSALGVIRDVTVEVAYEGGARADVTAQQAIDVMRTILRIQCGASDARVVEVQALETLNPQPKLTPEDAYLLSLVDPGTKLDTIPEISHMSAVESWMRLCRLVLRGLIVAKY